MPGWLAFIAVIPGQLGVHESGYASHLRSLACRAAPSSPFQPALCVGLVCLEAELLLKF